MRALLIVLDSVGIGGAPDADAYGDRGADTLGHILEHVPRLTLPTLMSLGLGRTMGLDGAAPGACWGVMRERSAGKDSTTGHWEIAGAVLTEPLGLFERFPPTLIDAIERDAGVRFIGNRPASGTGILDELGPRHLRTGELILYTSADSVLQIAAHERICAAERLYEVCRIARGHADACRIGRVIARPFTGEPGAFTRTAGRHDFSLAPPPTVLDGIAAAGLPVTGIGKAADLFGGRGFTRSIPTGSNPEGMARIAKVWGETDRGLVFANLVDFDTLYGHRRDVAGYAAALEAFDRWLAGFLPECAAGDLLIITADHGNDPTFCGTDHTRERVPLLVRGRGLAGDLGERETFADIAATLAEALETPPPPSGRSFLGGGGRAGSSRASHAAAAVR